VKWIAIILFTIHYSLFTCYAQDIPPSVEQQLENLADLEQTETEDDSYLQQLELYRRYPININTAEPSELRELRMLTDLQIVNFFSYRRIFGAFVSIYELQAVPTWDVNTVRKLIPFLTVASPLSVTKDFANRFDQGRHTLLLRFTQILEPSKGFKDTVAETKYLGSPQRYFFRYRYTYKNLLQFGVVGDKDAGEQFFSGAQNLGFDFYSIHLFARNIGSIKALALGDFTVNMGQGLIQWQSLAFKKSVDVLGVKRQSTVLRPYNSAGEFTFNRGAGITIRKGNFDVTAFGSIRSLDANHVSDTVTYEDYVSSFLTSGYHRTQSEIAEKSNLKQLSYGGSIKYLGNRWQIGVNAVNYHFSQPVKKTPETYNLFALSGNSWYNVSVDYNYTYKNFHFFGEAAGDKNFNKAFLNGLLVSVDPRVDVSLVHRAIEKDYQAVNGNAFTENIYPTNERGFYSGVTIRPTAAWRLDAYADIYKFPWLKSNVDAPSYGKDFLVQLTYVPNKQMEVYTIFKNERKQTNQPDNTTVTNYIENFPRQNWRMQVGYKITNAIALRSRAEVIWYDRKGKNAEQGFLSFFDFIYKPLTKPFSGVLRLQYFETDGYDSRLYAYENDILYSYSIPTFYDEGYRYYLTLTYDATKKVSLWLRLAQYVYRNKNVIGSGQDEIAGNTKTEVKIQARFLL
jgi:hypothetical protein